MSEGNTNLVSGDVGGRILSNSNLNLGAISVGSGLLNDPNYVAKPYGIVVGQNMSWVGGTLGGSDEGIFVGANLAAPADLADLRDDLFCPSGVIPGFLEIVPDDLCVFMQNQILSTSFSSFSWTFAFSVYVARNLEPNQPLKIASYTVEFGGIHVSCQDPDQDEYAVRFEVSDVNQTSWYYFTKCNVGARWIFLLSQSGGAFQFPPKLLTIQGGSPPVLAEKSVWVSDFDTNVDILITNTEFRGNLISRNSVTMKGCNVVGKIVVVNDLNGQEFSQQHPLCSLPTPLPLFCLVTKQINANSRIIPCLGAPNFAIGDTYETENIFCPKKLSLFFIGF